MTIRWVTRTFAVIGAAILTSGCGGVTDNPYNFGDEEIAAAAESLTGGPTLAVTERHVTDALVRISEAVGAIAPEVRWRWHRERSQGGGCPGPYAYTEGQSVTTRALLSDNPIRDADWPAVLAAAHAVATDAGMDRLDVHVDEPGRHDVTFAGGDGNRITFGTYKAASLRGITGCRHP
ncbi:lipoprotein LppV [Rhodococcus wratislaviensis]|uniref:Lipoprotein LppV n=1 Tax=Rhodococcus wratislaviensis TaxID=44752 RepID=A0A402CHM6_RHOWR|nr:lipoprotein LppV [Rhodococcus wratislaviensis]